jgi:thiamine-monophosphate kinase
MGAEPAWFTLSLSLPQSDPDWLARFSSGLYALAQQHNIELVGGDTVRGQLSISVQVLGLVELDGWLVRSGAAVRDSIYVSGCPGEAAGGLASIQQHLNRSPETDYLKNVFEWPTPRVQLGRALRRVASAAIDISDGLIADLVHICERSHVGACIDLSALPRSKALETMFDRATCERFSLSGGDDYELLFTAPSTVRVASIAEASKVVCTSIGRIVELGTAGTSQSSPVVCMRNGQIVDVGVSGYDHFA